MLKRFRSEGWHFTVVLAVLVVIVVYPVGKVVQLAFQSGGQASLDTIRTTWTNPSNQLALRRSLTVSVTAALLATTLGSVLAWVVTRTNVPRKRLVRSLLLTPFLIPPFVGAIAWMQLLGPVGYLNKLLMWILGRSDPVFYIYGPVGIILVLTLHNYPVVFLNVSAALDSMDSVLEEAAMTSGASRWRVLRDITLPLMAPAITAAALLVFAADMANFGVPSIMGMPRGYLVLTTKIYQAITSFGLKDNFSIASALALQLLLIAVTALSVQKLYLSRRKYAVLTGRSSNPTQINVGRWKWVLFGGCTAVFLITTVAPMIAIALTSLTKAVGLAPVPSNWTWDNFRFVLFESQTVARAARNSFFLGVVTATICTVLGGLVAYYSLRTRLRLRHVADFLGSVPYAIPGTVLALAMILAWIKVWRFTLYNTIWIILIAYVVHYLTFSIRTISASLSQVHESLDEAARMSGASRGRAMRDILLPLIKPGLIAGWFLVFMPSIRELTISVLLWSAGNQTIGVAVFNMSEGGQTPYAAAMGVLLIGVIFAGNMLTRKVTGGKYGF